MRPYVPAVLLALTCACASPPGDGARIVLERAERDGWWRATYRLDGRAGELRFQRPAGFYREDVWEVTTPGWRLERQGGHQLLVADAFAELALLRTGTIDAARLAERRSEALNRCVLGLGDGSLHDSGERGQFRNYYACGNILAVWSVAALGDPADFDRLFEVWRGVFANADREDSRYDRDSYFRALESLGVGTDAIDRLRAFVDEALDDPATGVVEFLASVDIGVVALDRPSPPMRRERAAAALEVTTERCRAGRPVTLGFEGGGTTTVPCTLPPPVPPTPLAFP